MRLQHLEISNFRCFEQFELELSGESLTLVAANAGGKSSVLTATGWGERAAELKRVLTSPADATHSLRRAEIVRRTERFDRACDAFLDAWSDLVSSSLQTDQLVSCVDELKDELETFRLRALSGREDGDLSALVEVGRLAGECRAIAAGSALPRVARGHTSSLLRRLHW
jgi:hypothetical protein